MVGVERLNGRKRERGEKEREGERGVGRRGDVAVI